MSTPARNRCKGLPDHLYMSHGSISSDCARLSSCCKRLSLHCAVCCVVLPHEAWWGLRHRVTHFDTNPASELEALQRLPLETAHQARHTGLLACPLAGLGAA